MRCAGRGIGASCQRNSSPVNLPAGRAFNIHWRFLLSVMRCPPTHCAPLSASFVPWVSSNCVLEIDLIPRGVLQLTLAHHGLQLRDLVDTIRVEGDVIL